MKMTTDIVEDKLSDGSKVFTVRLLLDEHERAIVFFKCLDENHAHNLLAEINLCVDCYLG